MHSVAFSQNPTYRRHYICKPCYSCGVLEQREGCTVFLHFKDPFSLPKPPVSQQLLQDKGMGYECDIGMYRPY